MLIHFIKDTDITMHLRSKERKHCQLQRRNRAADAEKKVYLSFFPSVAKILPHVSLHGRSSNAIFGVFQRKKKNLLEHYRCKANSVLIQPQHMISKVAACSCSSFQITKNNSQLL